MSQRTIAHLGAGHQLGNHRATYKPSATCSVIVGFLFLMVGIVSTCVFLFLAVNSGDFFSLIFMAFFLLWTGIALRLIVSSYQNRVMRVFVYDYGLIHVGRTSRQCIYWHNVQMVWHKVVEHTSRDFDGYSTTTHTGHSTTTYTHTYTINCIDGTQLKLDETFVHLRQLGRALEVGTAPHIFSRILKTYQMSQSVAFGPLTLTPQGLHYKTKMLPWTEMNSIKIDEHYGRIVIKKQEKLFNWAVIALGDLPNVEVFRMLVQHITGVRQKGVGHPLHGANTHF